MNIITFVFAKSYVKLAWLKGTISCASSEAKENGIPGKLSLLRWECHTVALHAVAEFAMLNDLLWAMR